MRLLFAHDHLFRRGPRGEIYTMGNLPSSVWERFLAHFDEVHVLARDGGPVPAGTRLARAERAGVTIDSLPNLSSFRQLVAPSPDARAKMEEAVRAADAVVARIPSEIGMLAIRYSRKLRKAYAVEVVGCAWDGYFNNGTLSARAYAPLAYLRLRRAVAQAPLALYVTSSWLQRRYPTGAPSSSASNVVLTPMDAAGREGRRQRLAAIAGGEAPVVGTVASLQVRSKGVQTAIQAIAELRAQGLNLTYRVLGPGDKRAWEELAHRFGVADLVHFDGTREAGEGVSRWLDGIDIHLQPSFQEGLPRGTVEAMSRGAACIGSTCGGIPELLPLERMHRPGDVIGLTSIIRRLVTDPAAIAAATRADLDTARRFDAETLRKRRSDFYARLRAEAEKQCASD